MVSKMRDQVIGVTKSQLGQWIEQERADYIVGMGEIFLGPVLHPKDFLWFLSPTNIKGVRDLGKFLGSLGEIAGDTLVAFEFPLAKLAKGVDALIKALDWCPPVPGMWQKECTQLEVVNATNNTGFPIEVKREKKTSVPFSGREIFDLQALLKNEHPILKTGNFSLKNFCDHVIFVTKLAAGVLSVAIFGVKYVIPAVGRTVNAGIDRFVALSASYGILPLNALAGGVKFVQTLGLDGFRSVLSFTFFSIESYELFKMLMSDAPKTSEKVYKTMELLTKLGKLSAIMLGTVMIFVPVTWPLVFGITAVGMIAAGLSLLTVFEKHRREKSKQEQFKLILAHG